MMRIRTVSRRKRIRKIIVTILSLIALLYILSPIYWVIVSGFQKESALEDRPPHFIPNGKILTSNHYHFIFTGEIPPDSSVMLQSMYTMSGTLVYPAIINSIVIALFVTLVNFILGFPAGHVFARQRFAGSRKVFLVMLATRLLPSISIVIPMYILLRRVGLLDTKLALILIYSAITLPFTIWILQAYFKGVPTAFEEAARIDGCGYFKMLFRVLIPLAMPGIIAALIFAFMTSYGEFVFATILTQTINSKTQTAVLAALAQGMSSSRGMMAAAATLSFLPPLILAAIFRKYILAGVSFNLKF
jgi:multiple sugar transport system permease protein